MFAMLVGYSLLLCASLFLPRYPDAFYTSTTLCDHDTRTRIEIYDGLLLYRKTQNT